MTDRTNPASLKSRPSLLGRLRWILAAQLVALAVVLGAPMPLGLPAQVAVAATTSDGIVYEQREPGTAAITGYEGGGRPRRDPRAARLRRPGARDETTDAAGRRV
jgi:hypothetical protein